MSVTDSCDYEKKKRDITLQLSNAAFQLSSEKFHFRIL